MTPAKDHAEEDTFFVSYDSAEAELINTLKRVRRHLASQREWRADLDQQIAEADFSIWQDEAAREALLRTLAGPPFNREDAKKALAKLASAELAEDRAPLPPEAAEAAEAEPTPTPPAAEPEPEAVAAAPAEPVEPTAAPEAAGDAPVVRDTPPEGLGDAVEPEPGACVVNFGKPPANWPAKTEAKADTSVIEDAARKIEAALPQLLETVPAGELDAAKIISKTGLSAHRVYGALHNLANRGVIQYVQRLDRNKLVVLRAGDSVPLPELTDNQAECLSVMRSFADNDGRVEISFGKIARASAKGLAEGSVSMMIDALARKGFLRVVKPGSSVRPGSYQVLTAKRPRAVSRDVTAALMGDPPPDRPRA